MEEKSRCLSFTIILLVLIWPVYCSHLISIICFAVITHFFTATFVIVVKCLNFHIIVLQCLLWESWIISWILSHLTSVLCMRINKINGKTLVHEPLWLSGFQKIFLHNVSHHKHISVISTMCLLSMLTLFTIIAGWLTVSIFFIEIFFKGIWIFFYIEITPKIENILFELIDIYCILEPHFMILYF